MRLNYRVKIQVEHTSREAAILLFEDIVFKLKAEHWEEKIISTDGAVGRPNTLVIVGPLVPSMEDRITALEAEFDARLGGISEENKL